MRVEFEITDIPKEEQNKYPTSYLEGILKIFVNQVIFFNQSGILLIEFAIFIDRWLKSIKNGEFIDLTYDTMDNDEPIFSLKYVKGDLYRIESIWQEAEVLELLSKEDIVVTFEKYLKNLEYELKLKTGIELNSILRDIQL
ncbi:MAG: hypothetical protein KBB37_04650 [Bacteroidia bacterium]|nr:hypothetical protein [Bacteroidia bacterium]MBP9180850.1 hypothetical protein [Bacteroidia bacterium]MBP9724927.1 hypothetical protein [Bacteroidia bacterium]